MSTDPTRKVNPRAKLKLLPEDIQEKLFEQVESSTLEETLEYVREELQITIGRTALADWAAWYRRREWIKDAESDAAEMEDMLKRSGLQLGPEAISAVANAVFLNRASKMGDAKTFVATAGVIQRSQELQSSQSAHKDKMEVAHKKLELQQQDQVRKMKELEMKVAEFERKETETKDDLSNPQLTEEQRATRMRERFGV